LHPYFEMRSWSQMQVAQRFCLGSMVTGFIRVALALTEPACVPGTGDSAGRNEVAEWLAR